MPSAIRSLLALGLTAAFLVPAASSAQAAGPGGWSNLGARAGAPGTSALDGRVDVFSTEMPGKLIAGGAFTAAGVAAAATTADDHIAVWDGASWSTLGPAAGLNGDVRALEFDSGKIYAGGVFTDAGGPGPADGLAVWDTNNPGIGWQPFCPAGANAGVGALKIAGSTLYVGSSTQNWGGIASADYLVACDLGSGTPTSMVNADGDGTGEIKALATDGNGDLYAGGNFINWGAVTSGNFDADYVVKYDLPSVTPLALDPPGIDSTGVDSLATIGNDLYVGTDDVNVDNIANADHIVRWNGSAWSAAGADTAGTNGYFSAVDQGPADVQSLTTSGTTLYASGNWSNANGEPLADRFAAFNSSCTPGIPAGETCWDTLGSNGALTEGPFGGNLNRGLAVYNGNPHVGGNFADAGGDPLADSAACFQLTATPCVPPPPIAQITPQTLTPITTPPATVKCKRGQKLKKGKCVKAKKKKKRK